MRGGLLRIISSCDAGQGDRPLICSCWRNSYVAAIGRPLPLPAGRRAAEIPQIPVRRDTGLCGADTRPQGTKNPQETECLRHRRRPALHSPELRIIHIMRSSALCRFWVSAHDDHGPSLGWSMVPGVAIGQDDRLRPSRALSPGPQAPHRHSVRRSCHERSVHSGRRGIAPARPVVRRGNRASQPVGARRDLPTTRPTRRRRSDRPFRGGRRDRSGRVGLCPWCVC